ncbi:Probable RNA-directed DNA polymerase from transposon BS [Eumeta japonica]|uniref:Probable RNA-directed DNA polymerase from transposon BS n=1 Tax=Eumeta variegata TaxID=151549 RepID=A0A4C1VDK5_EUMVA|nr:Probable RNA-directed DNA polymerase from transposon BS [Eumeta japonica]
MRSSGFVVLMEVPQASILGLFWCLHVTRLQEVSNFCTLNDLCTYVLIQVVDLHVVWGDLPLMTGTAFLLFTNLAQITKIANIVFQRRLVQALVDDADSALRARHHPDDALIIKRARALQRDVKARVQEFRNESWSDLMEEIRPSHKAFWKITKALKTEGYTPIPPLKRPETVPLPSTTRSRIEEEVLQKTSLDPRDDLTPVSLSEVQTLVKSLKTRKAPGLDGISNKAIKCFPQQFLRLLVAIFNACLQNCYFSPVWKEAKVIGIHKPGKPRDLPASYRPISLLSGLSKLYERVLKTRLTDHLLGKGLIIDEQFGFRPAHSCPQQVLRLVEYATEGFKRKNKTIAVFFDVAKAFDRVWHAGLVYKLYSLHGPDRLILIIQNYLSNRYFTFRHERTHSTRRIIRAGVPQGSALSPLLYSAYTNDIPRPTSGVQLALFADDTALFYRNKYRDVAASRLQRAIDELGQWFRLWRIEVNPEKSAAIQFKYSKRRSKFVVDYDTPTLKMLNARIPWQRS